MPYEFDHVFDFTGGENQSSSPDNLLSNESLLFRNVNPDTRGGFSRRKGITEYLNTGTYRIDRLVEFEYKNTNGDKVRDILLLANGELRNITQNIVLKTGLDKHLDYEVYQNKLYMLTSGYYLVYDGVTLNNVSASETDNMLDEVKKCRYIEQRGKRLFFAGNPDNPNGLYFSYVGRPEYISSDEGNPILAISDDADDITGIKEFHGALLVFKSRSIYAWFGYDPLTDVRFERLSVHTGTKAYRTIQYVGNYLIYLGQDDVYALNGTYKDVISTIPLGMNISKTIDEITHKTTYHDNTPCAVFKDGKYMLSVSTGDDSEINDTVLVLFYDILKQNSQTSWGIYTGWNISDFLDSLDGDLYSSSSINGIIHRHDESYSDLGLGIDSHVKTHPLNQKAPIHNKKYRRGYVAMRQYVEYNTNATITAQVDYQDRATEITPDDSLVWDNRNWGEGVWDFTDLITSRFDIRERGKRLIIEIQDSTPDQTLAIYGLGIEYKIKRPDRR